MAESPVCFQDGFCDICYSFRIAIRNRIRPEPDEVDHMVQFCHISLEQRVFRYHDLPKQYRRTAVAKPSSVERSTTVSTRTFNRRMYSTSCLTSPSYKHDDDDDALSNGFNMHDFFDVKKQQHFSNDDYFFDEKDMRPLSVQRSLSVQRPLSVQPEHSVLYQTSKEEQKAGPSCSSSEFNKMTNHVTLPQATQPLKKKQQYRQMSLLELLQHEKKATADKYLDWTS
jgi:hypothetical protein